MVVGTAGQVLSLAVYENRGGIQNAIISFLKPDGTTLTAVNFGTAYFTCSSCSSGYGGSVTLNTPALPMSGTYTVLVQQTNNQQVNVNSSGTGQLTLTLSSPVAGALTIDGTPTNMNATRQGQGGQFTVAGAVGQVLSLAVYENLGGIQNAVITILKPDATTLTTATLGTVYISCSPSPCSSGYRGSVTLNTPALPLSGTYTVLVQQMNNQQINVNSSGTGQLTLTLSSPVSGALMIGGSAVLSTVARRGQGTQLTFTGTMAQNLALTMSTTCGSISGGSVSILKPDNTTLSSANLTMTTCTSGSFGNLTLNVPTLPVTGTFTVLFQQSGYGGTGTLTSTLKTR